MGPNPNTAGHGPKPGPIDDRTGDGDRPTRRGFLAFATVAIAVLIKLVLVVPGAAYVLSPLRRRASEDGEGGEGGAGKFRPLARLSQLKVGVPRAFAIVDERRDAWVKYPSEPVGSVWLVRQEEGAEPPVLALTAECPHLGCAINLTAGGKSFLCPCHTSAFDLEGKPTNKIPTRPMDRLETELSKDADPEIRVKFQRFRTQSEEKVPLV